MAVDDRLGSVDNENMGDDNLVVNMRAAREALGWTQARLAEEIGKDIPGFSQSAVSRIEKGERDVRIREAKCIARAFGTSLDALSGEPEAFQDVLDWNRVRGRFQDAWMAVKAAQNEWELAKEEFSEYLANPRVTMSKRAHEQHERMASYELTFAPPSSDPWADRNPPF